MQKDWSIVVGKLILIIPAHCTSDSSSGKKQIVKLPYRKKSLSFYQRMSRSRLDVHCVVKHRSFHLQASGGRCAITYMARSIRIDAASLRNAITCATFAFLSCPRCNDLMGYKGGRRATTQALSSLFHQTARKGPATGYAESVPDEEQDGMGFKRRTIL